MRSSLVTLVLGLLFASTARSEFQKPLETPVEIDKPRWGNPIPTCGSCVPRERIVAPGVGFDLTASYGYMNTCMRGEVS